MTRGQSIPGPPGQCGTYTYLFLFSTGTGTLGTNFIISNWYFPQKCMHKCMHFISKKCMHFLKNACILVILEGKCWMHFGCMCIHVHVDMHVGANFQHASACIFAESGAFSRSCVGSKNFFWIFCLKMIDYYHKYPLIQNNPLGWS